MPQSIGTEKQVHQLSAQLWEAVRIGNKHRSELLLKQARKLATLEKKLSAPVCPPAHSTTQLLTDHPLFRPSHRVPTPRWKPRAAGVPCTSRRAAGTPKSQRYFSPRISVAQTSPPARLALRHCTSPPPTATPALLPCSSALAHRICC